MLIVQILAQAAAAAVPEAAVQVDAGQQGVISYRPEFFASFQPVNAMEMILRPSGSKARADPTGAAGRPACWPRGSSMTAPATVRASASRPRASR